MKTDNKNLMDVYDNWGEIKFLKCFTHYFNTIPNEFKIGNVDGFAIYNEIIKKSKRNRIHEFREEYFNEKKGFNMIWSVFKTKELVTATSNRLTYYYCKENIFSVNDIISLSKKLIIKEPKIKILIQQKDGDYEFQPFKINIPEIDIHKTYNDDLIDFDKKIVTSLNEKNGKGIVF